MATFCVLFSPEFPVFLTVVEKDIHSCTSGNAFPTQIKRLKTAAHESVHPRMDGCISPIPFVSGGSVRHLA